MGRDEAKTSLIITSSWADLTNERQIRCQKHFCASFPALGGATAQLTD
jgi:hypothetical protein